jgi:hypothetical protein
MKSICEHYLSENSGARYFPLVLLCNISVFLLCPLPLNLTHWFLFVGYECVLGGLVEKVRPTAATAVQDLVDKRPRETTRRPSPRRPPPVASSSATQIRPGSSLPACSPAGDKAAPAYPVSHLSSLLFRVECCWTTSFAGCCCCNM